MFKVLVLLALLALAIYLVVRTVQRAGGGPTSRPQGRSLRPRPRPRPVAPDDDLDFLRDLDRERKRKHPDDPDSV